jgi:hypothetical protein
MNALVFALMLQAGSTSFIVSTKAGVVNYVKGATTVKAATTVAPGKIVATGPGGAVELLLNPGSYLRMGENTQVVFDKVELYDIAVRILQGSAIIESNGFTKEIPLAVTTGNLKMEIIKDGIYLFADGKVIVVDGKIRDAKNGIVYNKGYEISDDQGYRAQKVKTFTTSLEQWSQQRDAQIAQANLNVARSLNRIPGVPVGSFQDVWLWYPAFGSFIYMPGYRYRSPYGYAYQQVVPVYAGGGGFGGRPNPGGANTSAVGANNGSNSGGNVGSSGGGFSNNAGSYNGGGVGVGPAAASGGISSAGSSGGGGGRPAGPSKSVSP